MLGLLLAVAAPVAAGEYRAHRTTELFTLEATLPDANDPGTGIVIITIIPGVFQNHTWFTAIALKPAAFRLDATVFRDGQGLVLLGHADGSPPRDRVGVEFPKDADAAIAHTAKITFSQWRVDAVSFDGLPVALQRRTAARAV